MGLRVLLLLLSALVVSAAHAQKMYKWVDKEGNVSYHDQPPPKETESDYRVEEKRVRTGQKPGADASAENKPPVLLYAAPNCTSCDLARHYLQKRGVPFTEKNVAGDRKLQDELIKETGGLSVPTIKVGKKVMQGYMESLLDGELNEAGYTKAESGAEPPPKNQ